MTVKERVLISRLIEKIYNNERYAQSIGLSYSISTSKQIQNGFVDKLYYPQKPTNNIKQNNKKRKRRRKPRLR